MNVENAYTSYLTGHRHRPFRARTRDLGFKRKQPGYRDEISFTAVFFLNLIIYFIESLTNIDMTGVNRNQRLTLMASILTIFEASNVTLFRSSVFYSLKKKQKKQNVLLLQKLAS